MKPLFVLIMLAAAVNCALGQKQSEVPASAKCSLTLNQSPTIRGLKLGMDVEEVLRQFPGSSNDPHIRTAIAWADKQFGVARFSAPTHEQTSESRFAGINGLSFEFLDRRLSSLWVQYVGPEWRSVDEFISRLSEPLNLPGPNSWEPSDQSTQKTLKCAGFEVKVFIGPASISSLFLRNPAADQIVRERQTAEKEKARQAFKP